jgi:uncharacterized membrane protein
MPKFFPVPNLLNQVSGVAEIVLAIGLLFASTRPISAYLIIAMLIVFFAVHIPHLFQSTKNGTRQRMVFVCKNCAYSLF